MPLLGPKKMPRIDRDIVKHQVSTYLDGVDERDRTTIRRWARQFTLIEEQLYKRYYEGMLLLSVNDKQAEQIIEEVHVRSCGPYMSERVLVEKILRRCHEYGLCQVH